MALLDKLRRIAAPVAAAPALGGEVPGGRCEGAWGATWVRRERFACGHTHGAVALGDLRRPAPPLLADLARDPSLSGVDLSRAVFFDSETTSLGGGVSTYVFLLGLGWFDGGAFVVEQYFLSDLTEEEALLREVNARFASFDVAVSFHGKGFDAPRLSGRLAFHGLPLALPRNHLDLCQIARSLYRGAFPDCRLQTLEQALVRFARADDLPGAECPQAYFSYLQGDRSVIPRVFEHNLLDVLTLPAMAVCFSREIDAPAHPVVLCNLGAFYEALGRDREARGAYRAALEGLSAARHALYPRALERLALLERRAGRHAESAALLEVRRDTPPFSVQALEDLSKHFEHRVRDFGRAEEAALDARSRLLTGKIVLEPRLKQQALRALDHRLERLRRRRGAAGQS